MLYRKAVEPFTLELLIKIQRFPQFEAFRLVGGTALALYLGHRKSIDLDFFSHKVSLPENYQEIFSEIVTKIEITSESKVINIFKLNDIKVDFVTYPYPWLNDPILEDGIKLATLNDIAAMKLSAITNRGTKKDFIDRYYLINLPGFNKMTELYLKKYSDASLFNLYQSMIYFEDAELDPMPKMFMSLTWNKVKTFMLLTAKNEYL